LRDILIKYRPIPFIPVYRTIKRTFPDKWHELSQEQFMHMARFYENPLPDLKDKMMLIKHVLNLSKYAFYGFTHWQIHNLLPLFDWMENIAFNKVFIQQFNIGDTVFHGPKDGFENLTFDEFIVADTYFVIFLNTKDLKDLSRLTYSLFRPASPSGTRMPIDEFDLDQYSDHFNKMNIHLLLAIVFNYRIVRRWLEQAYPLVFPKTDQEEVKQKNQKKISTPKWTTIRRKLANDVIADIPRIGKLPLHTVLADLTERIKNSHK